MKVYYPGLKIGNKFFLLLMPPPRWQRPVIILLGIILGLGFAIFHISNASSYLSDDPVACVNCHVMSSEYATWEHSSHRETATCNDCHVPHDNFLRKYLFKMQDGFRHAAMFTLRLEPQVIKIKEGGIAVVQENCIRCHEKQIAAASIVEVTGDNYKIGTGKLCWNCHREVPHGRIHSLAASPYARAPVLNPVLPKWIEEFKK